MASFKILVSVAAIASLLAGCAATPPRVLPDEKYQEYANLHTGTRRCGELGYMDLETASYGISILESSLNHYTYDSGRMNTVLKQTRISPTKEDCNSAAMQILGVKRQIKNQNEQAAAERQEIQNIINNRPRQTYCNQIGTQKLCTTY